MSDNEWEPKKRVLVTETGKEAWASFRPMGGLMMCWSCRLTMRGKWYTWRGKGKAKKPVCQD
jgi:hypothetical protein